MELRQPGPIRGGTYVVGYFDLLGQSNALAPFVEIEGSREYVRDVQKGFARVATQLFAFRADIESFFNGAKTASLVAAAPSGTASEVLALAAELESEKIRLQGFSDTVVAYIPTATESGVTSLYGVGAMLISVGSTMLLSIARGTVVRGAIEASWAMEPFKTEIYGPALMCAYELEKNANWPRVVLGNGIQKLWQRIQDQPVRTVGDGMNHIFAKLQSNLSFVDSDGQVAVDYLGSNMRMLIEDGVENLPALVDAAHVELERQLSVHVGNSRVQSKLQATLDYFISREGPLTQTRRDRAKIFTNLRHRSNG